MRKQIICFAMALIIVSFVSFAVAVEEEIDYEQVAYDCLKESRAIMAELETASFNVERVNASLEIGQNLYDSQVILKERGRPYDFSIALDHCDEISRLREEAFYVRDSFEALLKFYNDSLEEKMDTSSVDVLIVKIRDEIASERYEKVDALIAEAYDEISNTKAAYTTLNLFYSTTTRGLKEFLDDNSLYIGIVSLILFFVVLFYGTTISKAIIKKKIRNLNIRKDMLKKLIMKTQREYFHAGTMSESAYTIRTKKFAEMIRDIDRQIPLLNEQLVKLNRKNNKDGKDLNKEVWER